MGKSITNIGHYFTYLDISFRTQTDYQNKHYNINQKDERTSDDRGRDGGTNFKLRIKEQEKRLTLQEHDDDDVDDM